MGASKNSSLTCNCWWMKRPSMSIHPTEQWTIASATVCCSMVGIDRIHLGVCSPLLIDTLSKPVAICLNPLHDPCMGKINSAMQEFLVSNLHPPQLQPCPGSAARVATRTSHTTLSLWPNTSIVTDIQHCHQPLAATAQSKTGLCIHNMYMTIYSTWCCHYIAFLCTIQYVSTSKVQ